MASFIQAFILFWPLVDMVLKIIVVICGLVALWSGNYAKAAAMFSLIAMVRSPGSKKNG